MLLSLCCVQLFETPWTAACQAPLSLTISQNLIKLTSIESVMPSNHLVLCRNLLFLLHSFSASGSFLMSWLFTSHSQSIAASALASVLPMNIQIWFPLGWTGLISFQSKRLSRFFYNTTVQKHQFFSTQPSVQFSHPYVITRKIIALTIQTFVGKVMSLFLNTLSIFVITFLPRSKHLLISWPQSPYAMNFGAPEK